jgi:pyrroloquinoline quinone (PQQ) biosynthesis protein C
MTNEDIFNLISFCKENSITSFRLADMEFFISHSDNVKAHAVNNQPYMSTHSTLPSKEELSAAMTSKIEDLLKPLDPFSDMTEEEILFASTPYFDELQEKKALHQKKINEEKK